MKENCTRCGESYLEEHMHSCECGRYMCYRCLPAHKKVECPKSVNLQVSPSGGLQSIFSLKFLQSLDSYMESTFSAVYVCSKVNENLVMTQVSFKHSVVIGHDLKIKLTKDESEQLLLIHGNQSQAILNYYIEKVQNEIEIKLDWLKKKKNESSDKSQVNSYGYTPELANKFSAYFEGLSEEEKALVKFAYSKLNIRTIKGYKEYINQKSKKLQ
jgi:hypothetical protein